MLVLLCLLMPQKGANYAQERGVSGAQQQHIGRLQQQPQQQQLWQLH